MATKVNVKNSVLTGEFTDSPTVAAFSIIVEGQCDPTIGTELVGDVHAPIGPVPLGIIVHQAE